MTSEEAIKKLQRHKAEYLDKWVDFSGIAEALDMAIQSLSAKQTDGDLISRQAVKNALYELCDTGETLKENPWRDNPHIDALIETVEEIPSAEQIDSSIPQEDVADILNIVESALKGTNYEVVGYDNTDGFLKVLIDVK